MKKIIILSLSFIAFSLMSFVSLENGKLKKGKKWKLIYTIEFSCGHTYSSCGGLGEWMPGAFGLQRCHIPCWGSGSECNYTATIEVGFKASNGIVEGITMDLNNVNDLEILNMPSRSCKIQDENLQNMYFNIPAQTIKIDNFNPNKNNLYALKNFSITKEPQF